jgi:type I restriction enzyme S subunit
MSWPSVTLSSVAVLERDGEAPSALLPETRYIGLEHVDGEGAIATTATVGTAELKSTKFRFSEDHILYGKLRPYLRKIARPGFAGVCSTDIIPIRPTAAIDRGYLFHFLRSPEMVALATSRCTGANLPRLSPSQLEAFEIPLPPLPEQKRIAAILDAADALRAKRRESIEQLDSLIQATFLEMFGDPRQANSKGSIETQSQPMGQLTRIRTGKLDANAADDDGRYPFFTCASTPLRINTAAYECKAVLVAGNGDLNVKYYEGKFNAYQRTYIIESLDESTLNPRFLFAFLDLYVAELRKMAIGGVIKYIKLPYLQDAVMQLPSPRQQTHFASIVESIEQQKARLKAHLAELDTLFASLQARAFNGELVA